MKVIIPETMYLPSKGEKLVRENIDDGYPKEVLEKVETYTNSIT